MSTIKKGLEYIPGIAVAGIIASVAMLIEHFLPIHVIGSSVIALLIGMTINSFFHPKSLKKGLKFTSKKLLKLAIILLGATLSIRTILEVGRISLTVMIFTLFTCFGCGYFIGKALKLNWKTSNLISAGTGICGGSAIASIAPVIDAEDSDVAIAMSATFIFDMIMIIVFPLFGKWLNLNDMAYGLWAGTAVNDTSSVVAAGYAFSEIAGDFAVMVKLTRTLSIIPVVLIFSAINIRLKKKEIAKNNLETTNEKQKINYVKLIPWFILGFVALAIFNSIVPIPTSIASPLKSISKFLMVMALAAIGMSTSYKEIYKSGARAMLHGFIVSLLVVFVAIGVIYCLGIV